MDDGAGDLSPLCDLRASFELRTGAVTTLERLTRQIGRPPSALFVPESLRTVMAGRYRLPVNTLPAGESFLVVNGRWSAIDRKLPDQVNRAIVDSAGAVVAASLDRAAALHLPAFSPQLRKVPADDARLLGRPWEILDHCERNLAGDLAALAANIEAVAGDTSRCITTVGVAQVFAAPGATIHPHVVFDTSAGPVVIDAGATVRSMAVMVGPVYVGPGSIICNHAHIRAGTIIGPQCKVGGEVNASVFQGFANKAHSGYLGNSFVGEWVNLGADTVTSNLKNTYGPVRMQTDRSGNPQPTGRQFLGSVIGDHVKTAIGTRLLTGSCIHTGAMVAVSGFAPKCVDRFAFVTDEDHRPYTLDKFIEVARAVMERRGLRLDEAVVERIRQLHAGA
jgi:UDP-N-acetylglucosamine diphosphorylase / glucose-1-phosphate thymidylyltransferase / UDP-N-acetylgalactosamine diphosphorylase / glucosamine-1-phosphate N-acetyltransferase / galactosamine-1-phosphate N-acetyltransferase